MKIFSAILILLLTSNSFANIYFRTVYFLRHCINYLNSENNALKIFIANFFHVNLCLLFLSCKDWVPIQLPFYHQTLCFNILWFAFTCLNHYIEQHLPHSVTCLKEFPSSHIYCNKMYAFLYMIFIFSPRYMWVI